MSVYAGLQGLYALTMKYENEDEGERRPLYRISKEMFDVLGNLL